MTELKPALSYDEQIERLSSVHNLIITDKNKAKDIIKRVNYYRLSGYGIGLKQKEDPEEYVMAFLWNPSIACTISIVDLRIFSFIQLNR